MSVPRQTVTDSAHRSNLTLSAQTQKLSKKKKLVATVANDGYSRDQNTNRDSDESHFASFDGLGCFGESLPSGVVSFKVGGL